MNRGDVTMLCRRVTALWGRRHADNEVIDEWHRVLKDIEPQEAFAALDRLFLAGGDGPSAAKIMGEIRTRVPVKPIEHKPIGSADCGMCDGTGYMLTHDPNEPGVDRYVPCAICRPSAHQARHAGIRPAEPEATEEEKIAARSIIANIRRTLTHTPDGAA